MKKFECDFLDHGYSIETQPNKYQRYFLDYSQEQWQCGSGDGYFSYQTCDYADCTILVFENPLYGVALTYNFRKHGT